MKYFCAIFTSLILFTQAMTWANSLNLMNDSVYTLKAEIYGANGALLGQFIINPRNATQWSDQFENLGTENTDSSQVPYTVNWYCMGGTPYGSCSEVAAGSIVTAQSCGGSQECQQQPPQQYQQYQPQQQQQMQPYQQQEYDE